jgi:hypothetical protein
MAKARSLLSGPACWGLLWAKAASLPACVAFTGLSSQPLRSDTWIGMAGHGENGACHLHVPACYSIAPVLPRSVQSIFYHI